MLYTKPTVLFTLVLANLIPLFGVLFFGWDASTILFLYWCENIVIGIYNFKKIKKAQGKPTPKDTIELTGYMSNNKSAADVKSKTLLALFFAIHYGMFTFVHGIFVLILFGIPDISSRSFFLALTSLFISHGISYYQNFIGNKEYMQASPQRIFIQPYRRVIIMHLTILASGFFIHRVGEPLVGLIILIIIKIFIDIYTHTHEHKKLQSYETLTNANQNISKENL